MPGAASSGLRGREAAETYIINLSPGAQSCRSLEFPVQGGSDHNKGQGRPQGRQRQPSEGAGIEGYRTAQSPGRDNSSNGGSGAQLPEASHPSDPRESHWRTGGTPCPIIPPLATARVIRLWLSQISLGRVLWLSQISLGESSYLLLSFRFMVPRGDRGPDRHMILFLLWPDCQPPGSCCSVPGV